jgi:hypothetical protein
MKSTNIIRVCGSIVKKESLAALRNNILENTCVAEANMPYANYYGNVPEKANPNSLFLFTKQYYTLEEVLRFAQKISSCVMENVNVAASILSFQNSQLSAIRIKNFPDYSHLSHIQKCFASQGVEFAKKIYFESEALVKTNKCFILEEIDEGIYMDNTEENKGYILIDKLLNQEEFIILSAQLKNNCSCCLFDAAKGGIIVDSEVKEIFRVYSEKLELAHLKCIQTEINKILKLKHHLVEKN